MGSLRADKGSPRDPTLLTDGWTHRRTDRQKGSQPGSCPQLGPLRTWLAPSFPCLFLKPSSHPTPRSGKTKGVSRLRSPTIHSEEQEYWSLGPLLHTCMALNVCSSASVYTDLQVRGSHAALSVLTAPAPCLCVQSRPPSTLSPSPVLTHCGSQQALQQAVS